MNASARHEKEVREILIAANCREATEEQFARLDSLVRNYPDLANYAARMLDQQASLAWRGASKVANGHGAVVRATTCQESPGPPVVNAVHEGKSRSWFVIAAGVAFALGALTTVLFQVNGRPASVPVAQGDGMAPMTQQALYEARLVRSTGCLWDSDSLGNREIGSWLTSGESLHLLEGLAEFHLSWSRNGHADIALEGPAAMMLTSEGMPTLRFGRLTATISTSQRPFVLETPIGRLELSEYGSIGVSAFGNDGEIHVFDGSAVLEPAWRLSVRQQDDRVRIRSGEAVRVQESAAGELRIARHEADEEFFVAQLSMSSDGLAISPSYVRTIKRSRPLAYWRFERGPWPHVPNEMGSRFACRLIGSLGTVVYQGNQSVDFGVTNPAGEVLCDDTFASEIGDSYSIEFWMKPSHYHVGAIISLVGDAKSDKSPVPHGLLLEMGGTGMIPTALHHPGRLRFLHRTPASNDSDHGTSCYSREAYTLRKWQHVVAVKDGAKMLLYIDGALVGEQNDPAPLASDLRLLIGRLYPSRRVRPFVGQLDELAIYNRALTQQEIVEHLRVARPVIAENKRI